MTEQERITILAHHVDEKHSETTIKSIVIDTLFYSKRQESIDSLLAEIEEQFGVLIDSSTIEATIKKLINDGLIQKDISGGLFLEESLRSELQLSLLHEQGYRERAIIEWAQKNSISLTNNPDIFLAVDKFVRSVFIRHGAASYNLIAGKQVVNQHEINQIASDVLTQVDESTSALIGSCLTNILEYPFSENTSNYLRNTAKQATAYLCGIMPSEYIHNIEQHLQKTIVYLDTNILYRLLHLQGDERYDAVNKVVSFCLERKVDVRVSQQTYAELARVIENEARSIERFPTRKALVAAGHRLRSSDNYVSTFWKESLESGVSAEDFNYKYKNADLLLQKMNITVEKYDAETETLNEKAHEIYRKLGALIEKSESSDRVLWHDAFNMAYVQSQQDKNATSAISSGCFFLTSDTALLKLQRTDLELKNLPAICIYPSHLLQIFSFSHPKDEYYDTFIELFSSVSVGYLTTDYENEDIADIIGRISQYKTLDDDIAVKILEKQLIEKKYKRASTNEEKEEIIYQDLTHELESVVESKEVEKQELIKDNKNLFDEHQRLNARIDEITQDFTRREKELIAQLASANQHILEKEKEDYVNKHMPLWFVARILALIAGLLITIAAAISIFIPGFPFALGEFLKWGSGIVGVILLSFGRAVLSKRKIQEERDKLSKEFEKGKEST